MNKVKIGIFRLGGLNIELLYKDDYGADFTLAPTDKLPEICIGFKDDRWDQIIAIVLHEAFEFEMAHSGFRYYHSYDFGNDLSGYTFIFNHPQFSDLCGRVGLFLSEALPKIAAAWKKYKKEKKP